MSAFAIAFAILLAAQSAPEKPPRPVPNCKIVPGTHELLKAHDEARFLIMGESHGTNEYPEFFGDLTCTIATDRAVLVHLELPVTVEAALKKYIENGDEASFAQVRQNWVFSSPDYDGRGSIAMLALLKRFRELKASGIDLSINCAQPSYRTLKPQYYYEMAMANEWTLGAAEHPDAFNLVYVGGYHARRETPENPQSAASFLRPSDVITIAPYPEGGRAWTLSEVDGQMRSGPTPLLGDDTPTGPRGIVSAESAPDVRTRHPPGSFDAYYKVGRPPTPSPQAKPN